MLALARSRRYCFQSIGALGVIEMTAPTRAGFVDAGLKRLRIPTKKRLYFTLHAVLDVKHSECWNREVLRSLVGENPGCAQAIGEGAMHSVVAWRSLLRPLSPAFRLGTAIEQGSSLRLKENSDALPRDR